MSLSILTCSPYFIDSALNEVRRHHPDVRVLQHLAPGYILLKAPYSFGKLTADWQHKVPIYLHHWFPVHRVLMLKGTPQDLSCLAQAVHEMAQGIEITVQVRSTVEDRLPYSPADIQRCLNGKDDSYPPQMPQGRIFSILLTRDAESIQAYVGISWAAQNISPWAGGQIPVMEAVSNRAGYKLLEAIDVFGIRLRPGNHALDLGAAPGAWTTILRRLNLKVTAVAPTPLYPWLGFDPEVIYQPLLAEEFLGRCATVFDLIVNDMKLDVQDSARLMVDYASHLRAEGIAIMTLKVREHNRRRNTDHALRLLRKAYKIIQIRQLVSNRHEVTLFLRRKAS